MVTVNEEMNINASHQIIPSGSCTNILEHVTLKCVYLTYIHTHIMVETPETALDAGLSSLFAHTHHNECAGTHAPTG